MNIVTIPDYTPPAVFEKWPMSYAYQSDNVRTMLVRTMRGWKGQIDGVECKVIWNRVTPTIATVTANGGLHNLTERNLDGSPVPPRDEAWLRAHVADLWRRHGITEDTKQPD